MPSGGAAGHFPDPPEGEPIELNAVIAVDAHKRSHTFVAVDNLGREVETKTATTERNLMGLALGQQVADARGRWRTTVT